AVVGLWHLGTVVSASMSKIGHDVIGVDFNKSLIKNLNNYKTPVDEPGLSDLIKSSIKKDSLKFTTNLKDISSADAIIFTYDTPVDNHDNSDTKFLSDCIEKIATYIKNRALFIVMSQVPIGITKELAKRIKVVGGREVVPVY